MCNAYVVEKVAIVDLSKCPYEFGSPEFLNLHLKDLATIEGEIKKIRYEEEIIIELDEEKTNVLLEYTNLIKQVEQIMLREDIYGMKQDDYYESRKKLLRKVYEFLFINPVTSFRDLSEYKEPLPEKQIFLKGHQIFKGWIKGILKKLEETKLYQLCSKLGDLRAAFLSLTGLKSLYFVNSILLDIPPNAKPLEEEGAKYKLPYGIEVQIYEIEESDSYLYVQRNPYIENLSPELLKLLKRTILEQSKESFENADWRIIFEAKTKEYRQYFLDVAMIEGIPITPQQALAMGREAAAWVVGLGAPIENLALDKENLTDIYIDSENSPIYVEHRKFGICHTLFRYNRELLENAFKHIVLAEKGLRKFDENNPIVDIVLRRLDLRCHLQRPPATFDELQGALRIMKDVPFTHPHYFLFRTHTPFFAGYDDVMVTLGASEAVLGLKGCGKTSFTTTKIISIGTKRRIIPIQDIEEMPTRAFRKRGFHIGAVRVQSSDVEGYRAFQTKELDLVSMANALLRMGDAAIIINEVRSRTAVQGIINLLNTQPGVFLLYNLHAESLKDIQDRLELVFGIPSVSMLATDRYSFLYKLKFGRKGRIYRVVGQQFETDHIERTFVEVFKLSRGNSIENTTLICNFVKNEEAKSYDWRKLSMQNIEKNLAIEFIPPALKRRANITGIKPENYIMQAFFKGKVFYDIYWMARELENKNLLEIDFVHSCNAAANQILEDLENENGEVDFKEAQKIWNEKFKELLKKETKHLA